MRLGYTLIYVDDVKASLAFWNAAFGLATRFVVETGEYGELETGGTALGFVAHATARKSLGGPYTPVRAGDAPVGMVVGLVTEDVGAAFDWAIAAGATSVVGPMSKPWGQQVAYVRDPNGVLVELCSPMG
jgi:uncharacterized glyoxalase superfamily protein PhnB